MTTKSQLCPTQMEVPPWEGLLMTEGGAYQLSLVQIASAMSGRKKCQYVFVIVDDSLQDGSPMSSPLVRPLSRR